jgi:hypothetical protein
MNKPTPYFFGYGSLVNCQTHSYPDPRPAQLQGWQRKWVRCAGRDVVYLSVLENPSVTIDGLIAAVPNADWAALDLREAGYARISSRDAVRHDVTPKPPMAHYAVSPDKCIETGSHVILLSYLDVVVQGFAQQFGTPGVTRFFDTTLGWDTPVLDDRAHPRYPRAQTLSASETALVDENLTRLGATRAL